MHRLSFTLSFILLYHFALIGQKTQISNPDIIIGTYHGESQLFTGFEADPGIIDFLTEREDKDWPLNEHTNPKALPRGVDPALQKNYKEGGATPENLGVNFDGATAVTLNASFAPPDPVLDVGPNHVIQMTNAPGGSSVRIFDKSGNPLTGLLTFDTDIFPTAVGAGDPIVLYDPIADRWMLTEFGPQGDDILFVAISTTPNPVPPATWHVYSFPTPNFPDYPKFGVWPDAYYVTTNESGPSAVYALPRAEMLVGASAPAAQRFTMPSLPGFGFQAATPADLDGNIPPAGTPGIIMRMADDAVQGGGGVDQLEIWEFDVDWATPANTSLINTLNIPTAPFSSELCGFTAFNCFPQQGSGTTLDPLREVLMFRLQYRNFGTHQAIICNHVTDVGDFTDHGGIRWYELRKTGAGPWGIHQQGTYSPDPNHRWMGGIAMNGNGDIGMAYSVSSTSMFPSLRFTGRVAGDTPGQMSVVETSIVEGTGPSTSNRWGDYASLSVDPLDDNTFWFTGEYATANGWATRIASFQITCIPAAPIASFYASSNEVCLDNENTVTFTDNSLSTTCGQSTTTWLWTFEGGTPATSTDQNPTVTYASPGIYDVQLEVTNGTGSDTEIMSNYINVIAAEACAVELACETVMSTDIPKIIDDGPANTITSTLNFSSTEFIQTVKVVDLTGTHTYLGDLDFTLTSPEGTSVQFITRKCGTDEDFDLSLDDDATTNMPCPYNDGGVHLPDNPLAAFSGEIPNGTWTLTVADNAGADGGSLDSWGLEICHNILNCDDDHLTISNTISSDTFKAAISITSDAMITGGSTVLYQAGSEILLNPPLTIPANTDFTAKIQGCPFPESFSPSELYAMNPNRKVAQYFEKPLAEAPSVATSPPPVGEANLHIAPNPFQYQTRLSYKVEQSAEVYLRIHNALGQEIAILEDGTQKDQGIYHHNYEFNRQENGIYFVTLTIGKQKITKRMFLLR